MLKADDAEYDAGESVYLTAGQHPQWMVKVSRLTAALPTRPIVKSGRS